MRQQADNSEKELAYLEWPEEQVGGDRRCFRRNQPGLNICLDFHGDPVQAQLVVFPMATTIWPSGTENP